MPAWIGGVTRCRGASEGVSLCAVSPPGATQGEGADLLIGIGCAALVAGLATRAAASYFYGMLSAGASEISYTLYLVHFPVLVFLFFGFFKGSQMTPGPTSGSWFAITLGGVLLYSIAIWWLFERNTDRVRKFMEKSLSFAK